MGQHQRFFIEPGMLFHELLQRLLGQDIFGEFCPGFQYRAGEAPLLPVEQVDEVDAQAVSLEILVNAPDLRPLQKFFEIHRLGNFNTDFFRFLHHGHQSFQAAGPLVAAQQDVKDRRGAADGLETVDNGLGHQKTGRSLLFWNWIRWSRGLGLDWIKRL